MSVSPALSQLYNCSLWLCSRMLLWHSHLCTAEANTIETNVKPLQFNTAFWQQLSKHSILSSYSMIHQLEAIAKMVEVLNISLNSRVTVLIRDHISYPLCYDPIPVFTPTLCFSMSTCHSDQSYKCSGWSLPIWNGTILQDLRPNNSLTISRYQVIKSSNNKK